MTRTILLLVSCGLLPGGCSSLTRTPYTAPDPPLPARYEHAEPDTTGAVGREQWWREFDDPALNALVALAIDRNPDLAAAGVRVRRATLQARRAGVALLPVPGGTLSTGISRPFSGDAPSISETASGSFGVSWEVDLFGRLATGRDAATLEARATEEDRNAILLSLVGTVTTLHWETAFANERITLAGQSLAYARQAQALVETQYRAGAVSTLERREVEQMVANQNSVLTQLLQTRTEAREALRALLAGARPPAPEPQTPGRFEVVPFVRTGLRLY